MKGFFLGLLVAAAAVGGYLVWKRRGEVAPTAVTAPPDAGQAATPKGKRRRRHAARLARMDGVGQGHNAPTSEGGDEPEPVKLGASDLKTVGQGDDLSRPDVLRLDMGSDNDHELSQDEIDERFRAKENQILDCISRARPDEETYVPGRVTVKFRIQRTGAVRGVRVEAPSILMKGGLYGCIRGVVSGIRFPSSNGSQITTYPFSLS